MTYDYERATEIHEAAHALADNLMGIPTAYVSVVPDKYFAGSCRMTALARQRLHAATSRWEGYFKEEEEVFQENLENGRLRENADLFPRTDAWIDEEAQRAHVCDAHIVAKLAGPIAEAHFTGQPIRDHLIGPDKYEVAQILKVRCDDPKSRRKLRARLLRRAKNLMADPVNRQAIIALADTLHIKRKVTGDEAVGVLRAALESGQALLPSPEHQP